MAVKIRLSRTGGKNEVSYRIVVIDARSPRDGKALEFLGWYDPKKTGVNFQLKQERIDYWVSKGACLSDTVKSIVRRARKSAPAAN